MFNVISAVISHLYSNFLSMYIWGKMLGRKYTMKTMAIFTIVYVIIECIFKLYLFQRIGFNTVILTSIYAYTSHTIFIIILFRSSLGKKILVSTVSMIVMIFMEVFALNVTTFIFGNFELLQLNSWYTIVECTICNAFITIGLFIWYCLWKLIEQIKWESYKYQWMCLVFPISQWIMVLQLTKMHSVDTGNYPINVVLGIVIGILADIYMFYLFHRSNYSEKFEKELRQVNHQYELEKIRYEQLKECQEDVAKFRHDFQNYVLMLKSIDK